MEHNFIFSSCIIELVGIYGGRWVLVGPPVFKTGEWGSEPHWCVRFARTPAIYVTVLFI